ncbi:MAG: hypothetical protein QMC79_09445 [Anaerosomatales bacterium]|nr:hypothetical protein [Anaerosomatales bacterium]
MTERSDSNRGAVVFGAVLVLAGIALLALQFTGARAIELGWPLFVLIPGATMLAVGLASREHLAGFLIPGSIVTMAALVLGYQNLTGDWQSWSYAWALIAPTGVGIGLALFGWRTSNITVARVGRGLALAGLVLFLLAEWFFVVLAGIGGRGLGPAVEAVVPAAIILAGLYVIVRAVRRRP